MQEGTQSAAERWPMMAGIHIPQYSGATWRKAPDQQPIIRPGISDFGTISMLPLIKPDGPPLVVVAFTGLKGGVGRTTSVANIASSLAYGGLSVLALDLDPQNALRAHFGISEIDRGIAQATMSRETWNGLIHPLASRRQNHQGSFDLKVLPYGKLDAMESRFFEDLIALDPDWLMRNLFRLNLAQGTVVLIDLPTHSPMLIPHVLQAAHLVVTVSLVDAASHLCLARDGALVRDHCRSNADFAGHCYLFNQLDHSHRLEHDLAKLLNSLYSDRIAGFVHRDQSVREAVAWHATVCDYHPSGQATHDFAQAGNHISKTISNHLGKLLPRQFL